MNRSPSAVWWCSPWLARVVTVLAKPCTSQQNFTARVPCKGFILHFEACSFCSANDKSFKHFWVCGWILHQRWPTFHLQSDDSRGNPPGTNWSSLMAGSLLKQALYIPQDSSKTVRITEQNLIRPISWSVFRLVILHHDPFFGIPVSL